VSSLHLSFKRRDGCFDTYGECAFSAAVNVPFMLLEKNALELCELCVSDLCVPPPVLLGLELVLDLVH
jgi:hypothetical protein